MQAGLNSWPSLVTSHSPLHLAASSDGADHEGEKPLDNVDRQEEETERERQPEPAGNLVDEADHGDQRDDEHEVRIVLGELDFVEVFELHQRRLGGEDDDVGAADGAVHRRHHALQHQCQGNAGALAAVHDAGLDPLVVLAGDGGLEVGLGVGPGSGLEHLAHGAAKSDGGGELEAQRGNDRQHDLVHPGDRQRDLLGVHGLEDD
mmetsp:Transcript_19269/g.39115  ORF Transcript_19269/g.39115 Transcript_19269/m.39115 type:complete len:205 (-) Transcript_19269:208-822(-)